MEKRERVLLTLEHKEPDRIPRFNWFSKTISKELLKVFGESSNDFRLIDYFFEHDIIVEFLGIPTPWTSELTGSFKTEKSIFSDDWDITYRIVKNLEFEDDSYPSIVKSPLGNMKNFEKYVLPDPERKDIYKGFESIIKKYKNDFIIIAGVTSTLFERACYLRGFENFLADLYLEPDFAETLLEKIYDFNLAVSIKALDLGADIIWLGDDFGTETGLMMSLKLWKKFFFEKYAKLISKIKSSNRNIYIAFHSCGHIEPLIPYFIEMGVDIINPVQPYCNDQNLIKKKYGKNVSFWGTIDVKKRLLYGSAKDIFSEVRERTEIFKPGGGYIISSSNVIEPSKEIIKNIFCYYWALNKYSQY